MASGFLWGFCLSGYPPSPITLINPLSPVAETEALPFKTQGPQLSLHPTGRPGRHQLWGMWSSYMKPCSGRCPVVSSKARGGFGALSSAPRVDGKRRGVDGCSSFEHGRKLKNWSWRYKMRWCFSRSAEISRSSMYWGNSEEKMILRSWTLVCPPFVGHFYCVLWGWNHNC